MTLTAKEGQSIVHIIGLIQTSNCADTHKHDAVSTDAQQRSPYCSNKQLPFNTENGVPSTKRFAK